MIKNCSFSISATSGYATSTPFDIIIIIMAHSALIALILVASAAADNCVSSASWTKRDEPRKDCAWVGRLPEKRCEVRGAAPAGSDAAYLLARDACPAECDPSCAPEWGGRPR